ncbi:unnamed protein product [Symbiodinium natans]|uniref:EF-hand domain-containing protein n=1 Tax=Symbiodinium natans TaxID=878477 RepID=A0A812RI55_9DINO|nr:unnamed protein product [Symbiodinium natans]
MDDDAWLVNPHTRDATSSGKAQELSSLPVPVDLTDADDFPLLKQQHDAVMRRLDIQDDLLHQLLASLQVPGLPSVGSEPLLGSDSQEEVGSLPVVRPVLSYTQEDLQLQESAMHVAASRKRRRFSTRSVHGVHPPGGWRLRRIVQTQAFEAFFALVVLSNAVFIGIEVQRDVEFSGAETRPVWLYVVQYTYTVLFTLELALRIGAFGVMWSFRYSEDRFWSWLDAFIVASALWEVAVDILAAVEASADGLQGIPGITNLKSFRLVRLTRLMKMSQFMRIFRFVMALRTLVASIVYTLKALLWALVLLLLIVYVFGVLFTQAVNDHRSDPSVEFSLEETTASEKYWSSLPLSMLSLFMSIAGGVSWQEVIPPLKAMSVVWVFFFLMFIAFSQLAVLNVVTGVFCQSAIQSAQNDDTAVMQTLMDEKEKHLKSLRKLFVQVGLSTADVITFDAFEEKLDTPPVREYFESVGLDVRDAWTFFRLLDQDGSGVVDVEEFFMGCLRFRGPARSLDVGRLIQDQRWLINNVDKIHGQLKSEILGVRRDLQGLHAFVRLQGPTEWAPSNWKA